MYYSSMLTCLYVSFIVTFRPESPSVGRKGSGSKPSTLDRQCKLFNCLHLLHNQPLLFFFPHLPPSFLHLFLTLILSSCYNSNFLLSFFSSYFSSFVLPFFSHSMSLCFVPFSFLVPSASFVPSFFALFLYHVQCSLPPFLL